MRFNPSLPVAETAIKPVAFRPRAPWIGPDLQTIRNFIVTETVGHDRIAPVSERVLIDCNDGSGDRLIAELSRADAADVSNKPLIIIVHGLTGCAGSSYVLRTARYFLSLGYNAVRLNLRGAGPARQTCGGFYHAGRSGDILRALEGLEEFDAALFRNGCVLFGYSLGGNMVLNAVAGREGGNASIRAAATVSTPIDLAMTSETFRRPRNGVYQTWLLNRMKQEVLGGKLNEDERAAVAASRKVLEFDDTFIGPHFGFGDAATYYKECSANRRLSDIAVPTMVIHAVDDPWVPVEPYLTADWESAPAVTPVMVQGGGHVGFHESGHVVPWHDRKIAKWLETAVAPVGE